MRERMEMKTHTLGVALSAGWPMAVALAFLSALVLVMFPIAHAWKYVLILVVLMALIFVWCLKLYLGTYLFLPATAYKGARIIARLGRNNELEISGVLAEEIIVRQGWVERCLGVCHIRQKGLAMCLRGVREPETVKAWIAANFPKERKAPPVKKKKNRK